MTYNFPTQRLDSIVERVCVGFVGSCNKHYTDADNGVPMIRTTNLTGHQIDLGDVKYISREFHQKNRKSQLKRGDILVARHGDNGLPSIVTANDEMNCLNVVIVKPHQDDSLIDSYFLLYALKSPFVIQQIKSAVGGSVQGVVNTKAIAELQIPYPERNVREQIVNNLLSIDTKLINNVETNQTLEEMAQAIFKSWFVDFDPVKAKMNGEQPEGMDAATASLFPEKLVDTEVGELPEGWKLVPVGELLDKTIGGDWGKEEPDEKHTEEVRIVRGTDIPKLHGGAIESVPVRYVESKKLKTRKLERGDIVIEVSGGSKDQPTGRSLFISDNILKRLELPSEPASFCRRFKPKSYEVGLLLAVHFQLMYQAGKTWEYQNQSTGISNFQTKYFLEAEHIVIPSDEVLDAFVKQVSPMMDMIHSNQNIELAKLRDTLLPKLLSGEIELDVEKVNTND